MVVSFSYKAGEMLKLCKLPFCLDVDWGEVGVQEYWGERASCNIQARRGPGLCSCN